VFASDVGEDGKCARLESKSRGVGSVLSDGAEIGVLMNGDTRRRRDDTELMGGAKAVVNSEDPQAARRRPRYLIDDFMMLVARVRS
jgi:hypothetical protein